MSDSLPRPPKVTLEVVRDEAPSRDERGFVWARRLVLRNHMGDGHLGRAYSYDIVERRSLDAVVIVLETDDRCVCLRSSLRPPLWFRPAAEGEHSPVLWEVPAGLIEKEEEDLGQAGLRTSAARETWEEVGLCVAPEAFDFLGPAVFLSPGVLAERIHFLHAKVDPSLRTHPQSDGSPVEEHADVRFVSLTEALCAVRDGRIEDAKTEIALCRLAQRIGLR